MSGLTVEQIRNEGCLTYLVADEETREAALIDPKKEDQSRYLALLSEKGLKLKYVIDTHTHADHVSDSCELAQTTDAKVVMSEKTKSERLQLPVKEGSVLNLGLQELRIIETPGHTVDAVSIMAGSYLFTGDSLLLDDCGRTDFPGGDSGVMYETLQRILRDFSDTTLIAAGHDYENRTLMTLGEVKKVNQALQFKSKKEFIDYLESWNLDLPRRLKESLTANRQHCFKLGE
jgi:glyoxylase-like metal-dependent hydrolase (beta-lactamase superfamily II)